MKTSLAIAEAAIDAGDYTKSLELLDKLASEYSINDSDGPLIRMHMVTSFLGKGDNSQAINICKDLTRCKDAKIRESSKQLLSILEAPSLEKPSNWSIEIPKIETNRFNEGINIYNSYKRNNKTEEKTYPPTGTTKNLDKGFSIIVFIVLVTLTLLMSS